MVLGACTGSEPAADSETAAATTKTAPPTTTGAEPEVSAVTPAARMGHAMVDVGGGRLLVFGGRSFQGNAEVFLNDTWIYDALANEWDLVATDGPQPRSQHAMAYDPATDQVLLFGGYVGSSFTYGDTWLFDVADLAWRRVDPATSPSARAGSVATYDQAAAVFVMFAGAEEPPAAELPLAETWLFDPRLEDWEQVSTNQVPTLVSEGHPTLFELAMVYDTAERRSILMVAGESTWVFDATAVVWAKVDGGNTQGLGADYMTAAAYDAVEQRVVAYGGAPVSRTQGTWVFQNDEWREVPGPTPGPIANHAMTYAPDTESVYLFGGAEAVLVLDGVTPVVDGMWRLGAEGWSEVDR